MEFRAEIVDGVLEVFPNVVKTINATGGTDITVHALPPALINEKKQEILNKLARGEKIKIEVKDGIRDIQ